MAKKFSEFPEKTSIADTDLFLVSENGTGTKRVTGATLKSVIGGGLDYKKGFELFEDFLNRLQGSVYISSSLNGGVVSSPATPLDVTEIGVISLSTHTLNSAGVATITFASNQRLLVGGEGVYEIETRLKVADNPTSGGFEVVCGLTDTAATSSAVNITNGIIFFAPNNAPNWRIRSYKAGLMTEVVTTIPVNTDYVKLKIVVGLTKATFYINNVSVGEISVSLLPVGLSASYKPVVGIYGVSTSGIARFCYVDYVYLKGELTNSR